MYPFTLKLSTTKKSRWTNSCKWIIIHHTAWWTFQSNMKYLSESKAQASVHFVIWENWEVWKIWDPKDILWHAWNWSRWNIGNVNTQFLWIEVVWYWEYNLNQFIRLTDLVEYLMGNFNIPNDMILRHSDVTQESKFTKEKLLRDWRRKVKKFDIWLSFFRDNDWFKMWRNKLIPRKESRFNS